MDLSRAGVICTHAHGESLDCLAAICHRRLHLGRSMKLISDSNIKGLFLLNGLLLIKVCTVLTQCITRKLCDVQPQLLLLLASYALYKDVQQYSLQS
jgi:hypothetical protein